jgi:molybdenum cofactor guanylyltransferase
MYHHAVDPVTAFVLAGGKSSRMGQDKAFLQLGGCTLLSRALELATAAACGVWIVGSSAKFAAFGPVIADVYPERGPLGGIHASLSQTDTDLNLVIAVDLPFLNPSFLHYLISRARESHAVVVVPKASGSLQPLCAVYRRSFAKIADRSLRAGRNKVDLLFSEVQTRVIEREELEQNGFAEEMFRNLNTLEDWTEARRRASDLGAQLERPSCNPKDLLLGKSVRRPTPED